MGPNFDSNWIHTVKPLLYSNEEEKNSPVPLFSYTVVLEKDFFKDKFVPV